MSRLFQSSIRMDAGPKTKAEAAQQIKTFVGTTPNNENVVSEFGTTNVSFLDLIERTLQSEEFQRKLLNCFILLCSFGFAAYTILSIDNGMTRGWSSSEIAMRIPLDNWLNYENSLSDRPIVTKTMINVIIYLLGDWLSQTIFCGKVRLQFLPLFYRAMLNNCFRMCWTLMSAERCVTDSLDYALVHWCTNTTNSVITFFLSKEEC